MNSSNKLTRRIEGLLYILVNAVINTAAEEYWSFAQKSANPAEEAEQKEEIEDYLQLMKVALAEVNVEQVVKQATNDADTYLSTFDVNSESVDFYKLGYFLCVQFSENGSFNQVQQKIALMMAVYYLDVLLRADTDCGIPREFVTKMCRSIFKSDHVEDYGRYGIYSTFKVASKLLKENRPPATE